MSLLDKWEYKNPKSILDSFSSGDKVKQKVVDVINDAASSPLFTFEYDDTLYIAQLESFNGIQLYNSSTESADINFAPLIVSINNVNMEDIPISKILLDSFRQKAISNAKILIILTSDYMQFHIMEVEIDHIVSIKMGSSKEGIINNTIQLEMIQKSIKSFHKNNLPNE